MDNGDIFAYPFRKGAKCYIVMLIISDIWITLLFMISTYLMLKSQRGGGHRYLFRIYFGPLIHIVLTLSIKVL